MRALYGVKYVPASAYTTVLQFYIWLDLSRKIISKTIASNFINMKNCSFFQI